MLNGVSKTAILTLRARAEEHLRQDRVFSDSTAEDWFSRVSWPAELDCWYGPDAQYALAFRADDIDRILCRYAADLSAIHVTELGCGLSTRRNRLSALRVQHWVDVDLPEVVALRRSWGAGGTDHDHIAASVLDHTWMDQIHGDPSAHAFIAEGLLYYLPRPQVDALFAELRRRFPGSVIILDVLGANDYPILLANTKAVQTPIQWMFEGDFDNVLSDFGLAVVSGFEPNRLMEESLKRYWPRFDMKMRGLIFMAMNSKAIWARRSGTVIGRLAPLEPAS